MIARLPKDQIGSKGQLLEWDKEYPNPPGMSHISHLLPAIRCSINWRDTPELMEAVRKSPNFAFRTAQAEAAVAGMVSEHSRPPFKRHADRSDIRTMLTNSCA